MVTKKAPAKKVAVKPQSKKISVQPTPKKTLVQSSAEEFRMPQEVKDWIDQAHSRVNHLTSEVARLKEENLKLRRANKLMEQRVMGMSVE